ncbi:MAG: C69 family dipeptidase [Atopobiaceae bacterium]|jgi:dipeptidase|nr:C69 family dipeptidase [Atopobiaceae bacterium]
MKTRSRLAAAVLLALLPALAMPSVALACTTVIVGRNVSADGSRIISRNVDSHGLSPFREVSFPAQQRESDWTYTDAYNGFTCTLPASSYQFVATPHFVQTGDGDEYEAAINERHVCISATETIHANEAALAADPVVKNGIAESNIPTIVIPYVSSAREGVERLGALVEQYGSAEGSGVVFADDTETWYIEIYCGHQWAAVRIPDDSYAVIANDGLIGTVDVNDTENVIVSDGLVSCAKESGFYKERNGQIDTTATYCRAKCDFSQIRVWGGHHVFSGSQTGDYDVSQTYSMLMTPDEKISLEDVMEFMRYRYEGTKYDANEHPEVRPVGVASTSQSHVLWLRDGKPQILWECLSNPEMGVYVPSYGNVTQYPDAYTKSTTQADDTTAFWRFRRLATIALQGRDTYGKKVRDAWKQLEQEYVAGVDAMDARYEAAGESGDEAAAIFDELSGKALAQADDMYASAFEEFADDVATDKSATTSREAYASLSGNGLPVAAICVAVAAGVAVAVLVGRWAIGRRRRPKGE